MSILSNFLDAIKPNKVEETVEIEQEVKQEETVEEVKTENTDDTKQDEEQEVNNEETKQEETVEDIKEEQSEEVEESNKLTLEDIPEDLLKELYQKFEEAKLTDEEKQEKEINDKLAQSLKTYSLLEVKNTIANAELPMECIELFDSNRYINGQAVDTDKLKADVENIKTIINKITDTKVEQIKKELFADKEPMITTKPVRVSNNKDFDSAFNNLFNSLK